MRATFRQDGKAVDYTPSSAVTAGDFIEWGGRLYVAPRDIAANVQGSVYACGVFRGVKVTGAIVLGDFLYWNTTGDPVGGTAGTGALTTDSSKGTFAGQAIAAAASGAETVDFMLSDETSKTTMPAAAVAATGSAQGDAAAMGYGFTHATGADATKGVKLPAAVKGKVCVVKNADAANAILKVYPSTGDAINAIAANSAISMAAKTSATFIAIDDTTWYTIPLVPS